jgi:hypothetical protein
MSSEKDEEIAASIAAHRDLGTMVIGASTSASINTANGNGTWPSSARAAPPAVTADPLTNGSRGLTPPPALGSVAGLWGGDSNSQPTG